MNLQPILEHLAGLNLGVRGTNLFRYSMPESVDEGVMLTAQTPQSLNPYIPGKYSGDFQLIARGTDVDEVRQRAEVFMQALTLRGTTLGGMKFFYIQPRHAPLLYPMSDGHYIEASVNFECQYVITGD